MNFARAIEINVFPHNFTIDQSGTLFQHKQNIIDPRLANKKDELYWEFLSIWQCAEYSYSANFHLGSDLPHRS
jgi:hypothetical protein